MIVVTHFLGDDGLFETPESHLAPAADGHSFDQGTFGFGGGFVFFVEIGDEFVEMAGVFGFEEDAFCEHAVADGVAGGDLFAGISGGAAGFRAVGTGSDFLFEGAHCDLRIAGGTWGAGRGC